MLFLWGCAIMWVIARYPETPIGAMLKRVLIDRAARAMARLTPTALIFLGLVVAASVATLIFVGSDGLLFVAQGAPETVGWFFAFDVETYIDVIALAAVTAASGGLRVIYGRAKLLLAKAWRLVLRAVGALGARLRGRQSPPRARPGVRTPPQSDEGPGLGWAFA